MGGGGDRSGEFGVATQMRGGGFRIIESRALIDRQLDDDFDRLTGDLSPHHAGLIKIGVVEQEKVPVERRERLDGGQRCQLPCANFGIAFGGGRWKWADFEVELVGLQLEK